MVDNIDKIKIVTLELDDFEILLVTVDSIPDDLQAKVELIAIINVVGD